MSEAACVTGLGLVTSAGIGVDASWAGVLAGRGTAARDEALAGLPVDISCRVPGWDPVAQVGAKHARRTDRFTQLALVAAREAVAGSGLDPSTWDAARVAVVLGCGLGGADTWERQHRVLLESGPGRVSPMLVPMLAPNMVAGQLAIELGAKGPNLVVATACASGATAIGMALSLLRGGACDIAITGGTEASLTPLSMAGFAQMGALSSRVEDPSRASRPFDRGRDGFVAGEAAGIIVLERERDVAARGGRIRARMAGFGATADAHHVTAPDPEGDGAIRAMRVALADAGLAAADIGHVNAHGTSTPLNDATEGRAIHAVFGDAALVASTKGVTGHTLGAAGAIEAVFTVLALEHATVPPTANLEAADPAIPVSVSASARPAVLRAAASNSFGFGGQNACLVMTAA